MVILSNMSEELIVFLIYLLPLVFITSYYFLRRQKTHKISQQTLIQAEKDKLTEPASLHPLINHSKCYGCGACVSACPENNVLGLINNKAHLINPTNCIGHGACKESCPYDAIDLVFGTAKRGVDIPDVTPDFQTNVEGIFIAGELGGMGLIKNAIAQGKQAMQSVENYLTKSTMTIPKLDSSERLDCIIVGAGPAGISATLAAKELKLKTITIDQDTIGGTVSHFPRGKLVMTSPAYLPLHGKVKFSEVSKEALLSFWNDVIEQHNIAINHSEPMTNITPHQDGGYVLETPKGQYHSSTILLAIGRRGTPRKLGVIGEELPKVVYRLTDPQQYLNSDVLIVGGGDSALEAACSIAEITNGSVSLSYRNDNFNRAKKKNRERVEYLVKQNLLTLYLSSQVKKISPNEAMLDYNNDNITLTNDAVIVCAGGVLPTPFLQKLGIKVTTKYGTI